MSTNITQRAMLVQLSVSQWTAIRGDKDVAKKAVSDILGANATQFESGREIGRFSRNLIDPKILSDGAKITTAARQEHYRLTLPYDDGGMRIITSSAFGSYKQTMDTFRDQFNEWFEKCLTPEYPRLVAEAKRLMNGRFRASEYPDFALLDLDRCCWQPGCSPAELAAKFSFTVTPAPVPAASHFDGLIGISPGELRQIREAAMRDADLKIQRAVGDVWNRFSTVVEHMVERLKAFGSPALDDNGQPTGRRQYFADTLVSNITDLLDIVPMLNITGDAAITEFAVQMREQLTQYSPAVLRDSKIIRSSVAGRAESILASIRGARGAMAA